MRNCSGAKRSFPLPTNSQNGALGQTGELNLKRQRQIQKTNTKKTNTKLQICKHKYKYNKAIKDGGSTAGLPPNNKQKDHQ